MKNILQRGRPTIMSQFLQKKYGRIHQEETFKEPYALICSEKLVWVDTIKGDQNGKYYPARTFLDHRIAEDLPEYNFIRQLIIPEAPILSITQTNEEQFRCQCVDFFLPQANLVIEIDGQQHKNVQNRVTDSVRDEFLAKSKVVTVRISTTDLEGKTQTYFDRIAQIKEQLKRFNHFLNYYKTSYQKQLSELPAEIRLKKLMPTAIMRMQILLLDLLENGYLRLDEKHWNFEIKLHDVGEFAEIAIEDVFQWLDYIFKLQKVPFKRPTYSIKIVKQFSSNETIKIDFSLFKRWTDENLLAENVLFVRTDYYDLFFSRQENRFNRINYFCLATTEAFTYKLVVNEISDDLQTLRFFLKNIFEFDDFLPGQIAIIQNALERKSTIGLLPTGGGKSLTYQLPCLLQPCINFVVCPIKSLMFDQVSDLNNAYIQNVESITSDVTGASRNAILDGFSNGKYFFVFVSPERLQTQDFRNRLSNISNFKHFAYAVIDEVHCLSEWGHDFRTSYLNLQNSIQSFCSNIRFIGLTATASINVLKDIQIEFEISSENVRTLTDYTRPELEFIVIHDHGNKYKEALKTIQPYMLDRSETNDNSLAKCGLVFTPFVNGDHGCYQLASQLTKDLKMPVSFYSGSKPKKFQEANDFEKYKIETQKSFKQNKFPLLVATKAFGMGINKKDIRYTIHYGVPSSMEALYQEAGRAGRDKENAKCYILLTEERPDIDLGVVFNPESSYEQIEAHSRKVGWDGADVFRQIFLYQNGLDSISNELNLIVDLHAEYSKPGAKKLVHARKLNSNKEKVEKAIYRLSNLRVVSDWTVEDFFEGIFTVTFNEFSIETIRDALLSFIKKYTDDFEFDHHPDREKYSRILESNRLSDFEKYVKILLQWSYDKFAANRRESLRNIYFNCLAYTDSTAGKEAFKIALEAYFKFTEATHVLQEIAENNNKLIRRWFSVFYDNKNTIIGRSSLIDLEGNLQRFLESFQTNTGLNLINGLTLLLLGKSFDSILESRFDKVFSTIRQFSETDFGFIITHILEISSKLEQAGKMEILKHLYKHSVTEIEKMLYAKALGDNETVLTINVKRIRKVNEVIANGFE